MGGYGPRMCSGLGFRARDPGFKVWDSGFRLPSLKPTWKPIKPGCLRQTSSNRILVGRFHVSLGESKLRMQKGFGV